MNSKKYLIVFVCLFTINSAFATKRELTASVLLKGESQEKTMKMVVKVLSNNYSEIDPASFFVRLTFKELGRKFKINESDISILRFTDFKGNRRLWLSEDSAGFYEPKDNLIEERFLGKMSWYSDYNPNKGSGAIVAGAVVGGLIGAAIMGAATNVGRFTHWFKESNADQIKLKSLDTKELKKIFSDRPDLHYRIDEIREQRDLIRILEDYEIGEKATRERMKKELANTPYMKIKQIEEGANFDTLMVENAYDLKRKDLVLYKGRAGDIFGVVSDIKGSKLIEFKYYPQPNSEKVYMIPLKDVRKIILKESDEEN